MRITFTQEGGLAYFPGLNKPATIDADHLAAGEVEELKRLVKAARFFDLPASIGKPAGGAADCQHYVLTIEEGGRRHTVRVLAPVEDPALLAVVHAVQKLVKAARAAGRAAPPDPTTGRPGR